MNNATDRQYTTFINNQSLGESLGITTDEIAQIVHGFYAKVRKDAILGPIFENEMSENWEHHLEKMCNFWTTVMFAKPLYKGDPLEVHRGVHNIQGQHFDHWLALFEQTLIEVCPSKEHATAFYTRAKNMARVMTAALGLRAVPSATSGTPLEGGNHANNN